MSEKEAQKSVHPILRLLLAMGGGDPTAIAGLWDYLQETSDPRFLMFQNRVRDYILECERFAGESRRRTTPPGGRRRPTDEELAYRNDERSHDILHRFLFSLDRLFWLETDERALSERLAAAAKAIDFPKQAGRIFSGLSEQVHDRVDAVQVSPAFNYQHDIAMNMVGSAPTRNEIRRFLGRPSSDSDDYGGEKMDSDGDTEETTG